MFLDEAANNNNNNEEQNAPELILPNGFLKTKGYKFDAILVQTNILIICVPSNDLLPIGIRQPQLEENIKKQNDRTSLMFTKKTIKNCFGTQVGGK